MPLFVTAASLARRLDPDPDAAQVVQALCATIQRSLPTAPDRDILVAIVALALEDARVVLCVDGLDEVPTDLRERLRAALTMLEPQLAQLVVSCRESARGLLERVFAGEHEEFELTGFAPGDVRRFVRIWHKADEQLIARVERTLRDSAGLRTLVHVPLLLNFVCRLVETERSLASTRSGLYRDVVLSLLSGRWRAPEAPLTNPNARLRLLAAAVGPLAAQWRGRPDEFTRYDVEDALRCRPGYDRVCESAEERWRATEGVIDRDGHQPPKSPVVWELLHDGLVVESTAADGTPLLRFTHVVFGELCVALWLGDLDDDEQSTEVELHRWFDPPWSDVIPIACGVTAAPDRLMSRLDVAGNDPWLTQATLLANCLVEAPAVAGSRVIGDLVGVLIDRLNSGPAYDAGAARNALTMLLVGRVVHADTRLVTALREHELHNDDDRAFAMRLLCQVGESYAIARCQEIVADDRQPYARRIDAASAICRSDDSDAVGLVVATYANDKRTHAYLAASLAKGEAASQAALALIRRRDIDSDLRAAVAIEQLDVNGVEQGAVELLGDTAVGLAARVALVVALLRSGHHVDGAVARALVENPNVTQTVRLELVHALLLRGEFSALPVAADLVVDAGLEHAGRRALAQTMVSLGRVGAQAVYNSATLRTVALAVRLPTLLALIERRHVAAGQQTAEIVAARVGERWAHALLYAALLRWQPDLVDKEVLTNLLSDRELCDRFHIQWAELAAGALASADLETRQHLRQRIKRRAIGGGDGDLAHIDLHRVFVLVATSSGSGLDLLTEIACDDATDVDARIDAAMTAAGSDVGRVRQLEPTLDDETLPPAIRQRLVVALSMLGAPELLPRVVAMLPSEPAYVALRSVLRNEATRYDTVREAVGSASAAVAALADASQVTWDLDFGTLAQQIPVPANSETERELRREWIADRLRERTYARLLSLLLPAERVALHRVGGFVDSEATRNWLATWIPTYSDVADTELERLRHSIYENPGILPSPFAGDPFSVIAAVAKLLQEWAGHLDRSEWSAAYRLLEANLDIFASDVPDRVHDIVAAVERTWPQGPAREFLLISAQGDSGLTVALQALMTEDGPRDLTIRYLDEAQADVALGAASFSVLKAPHDAAGYFYAAEALMLAGQTDTARVLMTRSAERASPQQAAQGRTTLTEFGIRHDLDQSFVEECREILALAFQRKSDDAGDGDAGDEDAGDGDADVQ